MKENVKVITITADCEVDLEFVYDEDNVTSTEKKPLQIISHYLDKYRNRYNVYNNVNGDEDEWTYANENNDLDLVVDWEKPVEIYVDFNFWSENEEIEEYLKEKYGKQIEQNTDLLKKGRIIKIYRNEELELCFDIEI